MAINVRLNNSRTLFNPTHHVQLSDISDNILCGLRSCFQNVEVSIINCPDFSKPPFNLPTPGITGINIACDVGSFSYLIPVANPNKLYDFNDVVSLSKIKSGQLLGAGAGPFKTIGKNSEMTARVLIEDGKIIKNTTLNGVYNETKNIPEVVQSTDNNFAILGQFLATEGKQGNVIAVEASHRIKEGSIYTFIREILTAHYGEQKHPVAMGGVFLLENSKAKFHVLPAFPKDPVDCASKVSAWVKAFEMQPPVIGLGTIVSHDPDKIDLKLEHFHCYNENQTEAGHFYFDTEPETAVYHLYLIPTDSLLRIDPAQVN